MNHILWFKLQCKQFFCCCCCLIHCYFGSNAVVIVVVIKIFTLGNWSYDQQVSIWFERINNEIVVVYVYTSVGYETNAREKKISHTPIIDRLTINGKMWKKKLQTLYLLYNNNNNNFFTTEKKFLIFFKIEIYIINIVAFFSSSITLFFFRKN